MCRAMGGSVKFEDALAMRLGVMKPSQADVDRFKELNPPKLSKGACQGLPDLYLQLHLLSGCRKG